MTDWAEQEFWGLELGDERRKTRVVTTARHLAERPGHTIPQACGSWADTEGAYRLFENEHVSAQAILDEHFSHTAYRAAQEPFVTVIADSSDLDFTGLKATKGLGHLSNSDARGLDFFAVLVANLAGQPLGLLDARISSRELSTKGKSRTRKDKPTADKESQLWLDGFLHAQERLPEGLPFVYVADAEADIFDLFAVPRREGAHLLVRSTHERRVDHPAKHLKAALREEPPSGTYEVSLARGGNRRAERQATLTIRFLPVRLLAPLHAVQALAEMVEVYAILAEEEHPPANEAPIQWTLFTTQPTTTFEEARRRTEQYAQRWLIERYFFTLKSGCRVEELQLCSAERLIRAAALFSVVAWRLLWLMHESRLSPHQPCTALLASYEWKALYAFHYPTMKMPDKAPTLREAIRLTARLGGFLARRGDGEPGVQSIWLGFAELTRLARLYRSIANNPALCPPEGI